MEEKIYKNIKIDDLNLDLKNPRLGVVLENITSYDKLMKLLIEGDSILPLTQSIAENGYDSDRLPIVYVDKGKYVVLEGNRRVLALKILKDPAIAPLNKEKFLGFSDTFKKNGHNEDNIDVYVYKDKNTANKLIAKIHTAKDIKGWDIYSQGKFYYEQLFMCESKKKFIKKFGLTSARAHKLIFLFKFIEYIKLDSKLPGSLKDLFVRGSTFESVIDKLFFANKKKWGIRLSEDYKNIEIEDKGKLNSKLKKVIPKLSLKIGDVGKITTRSFNSFKDKIAIEKYIRNPNNFSNLSHEGAQKIMTLSDSYSITEPKQKKLNTIFKLLDKTSINEKNILWYSILYFILLELFYINF